MKNKPIIRHANVEDLPSIVDIYNQSIRSGTATGDMEEFSVEQRLEWFNKFDFENYPIFVAEEDNSILGYSYISPYRNGRKAMKNIAELSFFVDYLNHGKGIGSQLISFSINDCQRIAKHTLVAILLDINKESISILKKFKFEEWGRIPKSIDLNGSICDHLIYGLKV